ncbi:MAG: M56 family metallopeptidase [Bacteroidetes bacterium]|nr:M56 family metallopeptidase [Bacteroidota bacterium]
MNGFQLIDPGLSLFENLFLPTLAWSVVVGFVFIFIHFLFAENPRFQTQIRILLLWTLPAAIFINFILNTQFVQSKPDFIVIPNNILILNTDTIEPVPAAISEPSPDIYEQIKAITGWISGLTILIGFSYFTGYLLLFHRLARYHQYLILIPENEVIKLILLENDLNSKVTVYQSNGFVTPFTFGFSHPKIIIPEKYCSDPVQFQLILRHEVSHIRNHDYLKQMGEQALKFLFFWNPLLHLLTRQISNYREMACDVQVLTVCPDWKKEYATLLLTHLSEPAASTGVAAAMSHSTENLKERISKMKTYQTIKENKIATGVLAGVLTAFSITFILLVSNARLEAVEKRIAGQEQTSEPDTLNRDFPELVGGMESISELMKNLKYPELARNQGKEGTILLNLKVSATGEIEDITVKKSTGSATLDAQAVVAAQDLKFKPALKDGKGKASEVTFPIKFKLQNEKAEGNSEESSIPGNEPPQIKGGFGELMKNVVYPEDALKKGIEGKALLNVVVSEKGEVKKTEVLESSGNAELDKAAIEAAKATKFIPGKKDGKAVAAEVKIPFQFKLK